MSQKSRSTLRPLIALSTVSLLALTSCGNGGGDGEGGTITIGVTGPQSGGGALYGENVEAGIRLAIDELNEQGVTIDGEEYTVEMRALDDEYQPNAAATNAQRLVEQDDASVVFIPHAGGIHAAQEINTSRSDFLIGAYSSDRRIIERDNELTFMISPPFVSYSEPFIRIFQEEQGAERLGLLATASEYGQQWTTMITQDWEDAGGEVLSNNNFDYGAVSDFASSVARTLSDDPDVILVGGPSQTTALVIEEARDQGYEGGFMIMDQAKFEELELFTDPENLNNSAGVKPVAEFDDPGTDSLVERFAEDITEERPITAETSLNFQAVALVVKAMEIAGTHEDPAAIREAMPEAAAEVDDVFRVSGFPDEVTDEGLLISDSLEGAYRDSEGNYEYFPMDIE
ncbi:ABC transporter substrate-binding protein [Nesterenkonia alkaliphila]|uniref:ABC transporter substrate-binding protein n=1 Tax=Nesterenkonia alkaliphila TaxID=1463631 RepID=A0A7K1UK41_9MICC|nr:ABC transporter substrate-binding protein [Nesterenkonia alkaliphila]MVT26381.1 ABC transporter substrate-binding protein [Nesterenkonia alkaliphila]GFZ98694.1 branched-chain amino acid ABC transporter substrate-binding protein [Nesterenkonia alkaliphila]